MVYPGWVGRVVEVVNGAGPAHGKEASEAVWGRRADMRLGRECYHAAYGHLQY